MSRRFDSDFAPDERTDAIFMAAAIAYGRRGLGTTAPNPAVGCVIVRDGVIVGRGATQAGGRPHAETEAIRDAGEKARGATLYVSLEPCSHHGVTPPCADAIVEAGLARVVSAIEDPDRRVAGRGHAKLVEAGIGLRVGIGATEARRLTLGHILRVTEGRPMVTLKLAETSDGFAAGGEHDPRLMITGQAANGRVQILRAMHDAIMVGVGTALADDPLLTVRSPGMNDRRPLRVVLDTHLRLPATSRIAVTARERRTLVIAGRDAPVEKQLALEALGIEIERVDDMPDRHVDLAQALRALGRRGITRVFSEGGPTVAADLIARDMADEVVVFTSPKPFARAGIPALDPVSRETLGDARHYRLFATGHAGIDTYRHFERAV
jgi:diaminohydroxyphosphoribosylaminopyrimidine deaminase/5-amino-6-(5-phosphoribosylamino)uracil reductase